MATVVHNMAIVEARVTIAQQAVKQVLVLVEFRRDQYIQTHRQAFQQLLVL